MENFRKFFAVTRGLVKYNDNCEPCEYIIHSHKYEFITVTRDYLVDAFASVELPKQSDMLTCKINNHSAEELEFFEKEEGFKLDSTIFSLKFFADGTLAAEYFPYCDECDIYDFPLSQLRRFLEICKSYKEP